MAKGKAKMSEESQDAPASDVVGNNKMEAVRRAVQALGHDAKPQVLHDFIQTEFKLDIPANMISSYKSTILKKSGGKRRGRPSDADGGVSPGDAGASGISLKDLKTIKELARRLGAGRLRELVDVLT